MSTGERASEPAADPEEAMLIQLADMPFFADAVNDNKCVQCPVCVQEYEDGIRRASLIVIARKVNLKAKEGHIARAYPCQFDEYAAVKRVKPNPRPNTAASIRRFFKPVGASSSAAAPASSSAPAEGGWADEEIMEDSSAQPGQGLETASELNPPAEPETIARTSSFAQAELQGARAPAGPSAPMLTQAAQQLQPSQPSSTGATWFGNTNAAYLVQTLVAGVRGLLVSTRDAKVESALDAFASRVAEKVAVSARADRDAEAECVATAGTLLERTLALCKTVAEASDICGFEIEGDFVWCCNCTARLQSEQRRAIPRQLLQGANRNSFGVFKALQELKALKNSLKSHLSSAAHKWSMDAVAADPEMSKRQRSVGLSVSRLAYMCIKEGDSYSQFKCGLLTLHLSGARIGEKNHSHNFMKPFSESVEKVMRASMKRLHGKARAQTGSCPVFSLNADKPTCMRRTSQLVVAIVLVNGKFVPIFIGCRKTGSEHHGEHTAQHLMDVLTEDLGLSKRHLRVQFVCFAADGAYFSTNEPAYLARKVCVLQAWLLPGHDDAHRLELVVNDIRKAGGWYSEIAAKLSALQLDYRYGKHYEEVLELADIRKAGGWYSKIAAKLSAFQGTRASRRSQLQAARTNVRL
jgi:hypothetical protein